MSRRASKTGESPYNYMVVNVYRAPQGPVKATEKDDPWWRESADEGFLERLFELLESNSESHKFYLQQLQEKQQQQEAEKEEDQQGGDSHPIALIPNAVWSDGGKTVTVYDMNSLVATLGSCWDREAFHTHPVKTSARSQFKMYGFVEMYDAKDQLLIFHPDFRRSKGIETIRNILPLIQQEVPIYLRSLATTVPVPPAAATNDNESLIEGSKGRAGHAGGNDSIGIRINRGGSSSSNSSSSCCSSSTSSSSSGSSTSSSSTSGSGTAEERQAQQFSHTDRGILLKVTAAGCWSPDIEIYLRALKTRSFQITIPELSTVRPKKERIQNRMYDNAAQMAVCNARHKAPSDYRLSAGLAQAQATDGGCCCANESVNEGSAPAAQEGHCEFGTQSPSDGGMTGGLDGDNGGGNRRRSSRTKRKRI